MLLLTIKGKETSFALVSMTADSELRKGDIRNSVTTYLSTTTLTPPQKETAST